MDAERKKQIDDYLELSKEERREHLTNLVARLEHQNAKNQSEETERVINNLKALLWARYKTLVC